MVVHSYSIILVIIVIMDCEHIIDDNDHELVAINTPLLDTINTLTTCMNEFERIDDNMCYKREQMRNNKCLLAVNNSNTCSVNSNNSKSVRFDNDVKIMNSFNAYNDNNNAKSDHYSVINKSILKDPLCDTLLTSIKAGEFKSDSNVAAEAEIDELLYGSVTNGYHTQTHYETNGHLDPAATYVTMIEEKYHSFTGKSATAKQSSLTSRKTAKGMTL
jgi:hypothetical protein